MSSFASSVCCVATHPDLDFMTFIPHCGDKSHGARTINIAKSTYLGR
jgi:hypothetical protein